MCWASGVQGLRDACFQGFRLQIRGGLIQVGGVAKIDRPHPPGSGHQNRDGIKTTDDFMNVKRNEIKNSTLHIHIQVELLLYTYT